jgi:RNA polymerase sigma-70 factor (ECF subfamily)
MPNEESLDWSRLVERHAERVFRIALRILGSVHDAEDVSQIVFTEAVAIHDVEVVQSWTGLFVRLATLRSLDLLRRRRGTVALIESDHVSNIGPCEAAVGAELADWLRGAVNQLPEQQAAIFSLTYFEQLDRNEVASVLRISPESVSTALYKARQKLTSQIAVFNGER